MTTVLNAVRAHAHAARVPSKKELRIALLGLGHVGSAVAELGRQVDLAHRFSIVSALVRDVNRPRSVDTTCIPLTADPLDALASGPDVVIEVLGGLEPARTIVLAALSRGLPVVTANKSLLAAHGDELFDAAASTGAPLLYEASVLAGVPFLCTFRHRPLARDVFGISGIVNGTSNFILTRMLADRVSFIDALGEAQRAGYAEPDPAKDISSDDAVEKLCVLVRHFAGWSIAPADVERTGIADVELDDLQQATACGGSIRPIVSAEWSHDGLSAFAGPAFVGAPNGLARVNGVQNAVSLRTRWSGDLFFSGPGAGPAVTAATVLDDVVEAHSLADHPVLPAMRPSAACTTPDTGWFIRLMSADVHNEQDAPVVLTSLGVRMRRTSPLIRRDGHRRQWMLTHACSREHVTAALAVLAGKHGGDAWMIRAME